MAFSFLGKDRLFQVVKNPHIDKPKVVILCSYDPSGISTVIDHISAVANIAWACVEIYNLYYFEDNIKRFNKMYSAISNSDALIIHNTSCYRLEQRLDLFRKLNIQNLNIPKILMKQDEQINPNLTVEFLIENKFTALTTCMRGEKIRGLYSKLIDKIEVVSLFSGYIPKQKPLENKVKSLNRKYMIGYRGDRPRYEYGKIAFEKYNIGNVFKDYCNKYNISSSIEMDPSKRILGNAWYSFLSNCKGVLAVESGASIVDWDGALFRKLTERGKTTADLIDYNDIYINSEGNFNYTGFSPRIFETFLAGSVPVLLEGDWEGLLEKDINYLSVNKSYSNLDEIIYKLNNNNLCLEIINNNVNKFLKNDSFSYVSLERSIKHLLRSIQK